MTATVTRLPIDAPDLDEQVRALEPGQWVRVHYFDPETKCRVTVEGVVRRPSELTQSLWVGAGSTGCLIHYDGHVHDHVTSIETAPRPELDMDALVERVTDWVQAVTELEEKPVGRFKTGDNTREANAVQMAREYVVAYLRAVTLR